MKASGSNEQHACIMYKIQRSVKFFSWTPTNLFIVLPSIFAVNPFERFISPVSIANIEDSIFEGIIFAKRTMPGSL